MGINIYCAKNVLEVVNMKASTSSLYAWVAVDSKMNAFS